MDRFQQANEEYLRRNQRLIVLQGLFIPTMSLLLGLGATIVLWLGSRAVIGGRITVGQFVAFSSCVTLLSWPVAALWRLWRNRPRSEDRGGRHKHLAVRLVLLVDAAVIVATVAPFIVGSLNPTIYDDALDQVLIVLYALAWVGVLGVVATLWAATLFWRRGVGSRWSRIRAA